MKDRNSKNEKKRKVRENEEADRIKKKRQVKDELSKFKFLEKSCLTEEHPTSSPNSSDSNEKPEQIQNLNGNALRVCQEKGRVPLSTKLSKEKKTIRQDKGQKDHEVVMTSKDQTQCSSQTRLEDASQTSPCKPVVHPCSTSANEKPEQNQILNGKHNDSGNALRVCQDKRRVPLSTKVSKEKKTIPHVKSRKRNREISTKPCKENIPRQENLSSGLQKTIGTSKLCSKCPPSVAEQYWTPDLVQTKLTDSEDEDWWLVVKKFDAKRQKQVSNQTTSNEISSMVWPTARYLPEAELYALPYTVPF